MRFSLEHFKVIKVDELATLDELYCSVDGIDILTTSLLGNVNVFLV